MALTNEELVLQSTPARPCAILRPIIQREAFIRGRWRSCNMSSRYGRRPREILGIYQGADLRVICQDVRDEAGNPVDLQDATGIEFWFGRTARSNPVLKKSLADGSVTINNPTSFTFDLEPADTRDLRGTYHMEGRIWTDAAFNDVAISGVFYVWDALIPDTEV